MFSSRLLYHGCDGRNNNNMSFFLCLLLYFLTVVSTVAMERCAAQAPNPNSPPSGDDQPTPKPPMPNAPPPGGDDDQPTPKPPMPNAPPPGGDDDQPTPKPPMPNAPPPGGDDDQPTPKPPGSPPGAPPPSDTPTIDVAVSTTSFTEQRTGFPTPTIPLATTTIPSTASFTSTFLATAPSTHVQSSTMLPTSSSTPPPLAAASTTLSTALLPTTTRAETTSNVLPSSSSIPTTPAPTTTAVLSTTGVFATSGPTPTTGASPSLSSSGVTSKDSGQSSGCTSSSSSSSSGSLGVLVKENASADDDGLSAAAWVGIILAVLVGLALLVALFVVARKKLRGREVIYRSEADGQYSDPTKYTKRYGNLAEEESDTFGLNARPEGEIHGIGGSMHRKASENLRKSGGEAEIPLLGLAALKAQRGSYNPMEAVKTASLQGAQGGAALEEALHRSATFRKNRQECQDEEADSEAESLEFGPGELIYFEDLGSPQTNSSPVQAMAAEAQGEWKVSQLIDEKTGAVLSESPRKVFISTSAAGAATSGGSEDHLAKQTELHNRVKEELLADQARQMAEEL